MKSVHLVVLMIVGLLLQSCGSAPATTPIPTNNPIAAATATSTAVAPTRSAAPSPTNTRLPEPTRTASPDPVQNTPASLMLHRRNVKFDALQFLKDFIVVLKQNDAQVITYRSLSDKNTKTAPKQGKQFIISIDDIYLRYPIDESVQEMINALVEAGYPAVLGVITEGDQAYPETVGTLRKLQNLGWEIASHSDTHRNLADVEKMAPKSIYPEIKTSLDKLELAVGLRPVTLILPEGQMTRGDQQIKRSGVLWVVGIAGGTQYDTRSAYYYVGREGPDLTAMNTFSIMLKRFSP